MAEMIKKFTMRRWNGSSWDQLYPKTSADVIVFANDYTGSYLIDTDVQSALETIDLRIGDLTTLNTDAQNDLVSAINEVWQTVDDQVLSWTVKGDTGEVTVSTDEIVQYLGDDIIATAVTRDAQTDTTTVQLSHSQTAETSIENLLDGDVISDIVIDGFGHIVSLDTRTLVADDIMSSYVDTQAAALSIDGALLDIDVRLDAIEDNLLIDGFLDATENTYDPYAQKTGATDFVHFYYGSTDPDATATRLNLNANLHAAKFNNLLLEEEVDGFTITGGSSTSRTLTVGASSADQVAIFGSNGQLTSEAQLDETRGGTGIGSYSKGDLLYASATDTLAKRTIGTENQVLVVASDGTPVWTTNLNVGIINASDVTMTGTLRGPSTFTIDASPDGNAGTVVIEGDLIVRGATTTVNSENVTIKDAFISLNNDTDAENPGSIVPTVDAGIEIERYSATNVQLFWDESEDDWYVTNGTTLTSQDTNTSYSQFELLHAGNFTIPMINSPITNYNGPVYVGAMVYEVTESIAV